MKLQGRATTIHGMKKQMDRLLLDVSTDYNDGQPSPGTPAVGR